MELLRSLIFVPGNRANMLERALGFPADIIMVDLEDSVPPGEKVAARQVASQWIPRLRQAGQRVMVRANSLDTGLTPDELQTLISPDLYGVSVGKTESASDLLELERLIASLESAAGLDAGQIRLIPWIESARAMVNVNEMADALDRTVGIAFGAEDFTNDMGIQRTDEGHEVYHARCTVAIASLDSPYVAFRNPEGLRSDAGAARQMGYTGKFAIHPSQVESINELFSPLPEDVDYARRVMEAWREAEANGRGSLALDDKMVDVPVVKRAQNLLALVDVIESQLAARGRQ